MRAPRFDNRAAALGAVAALLVLANLAVASAGSRSLLTEGTSVGASSESSQSYDVKGSGSGSVSFGSNSATSAMLSGDVVDASSSGDSFITENFSNKDKAASGPVFATSKQTAMVAGPNGALESEARTVSEGFDGATAKTAATVKLAEVGNTVDATVNALAMGTTVGMGFSNSKVSGSGAIREENAMGAGAAAAGAQLAGYSEAEAFEKDASTEAKLDGFLEASELENPVEEAAEAKAVLNLMNSASGLFADTLSNGEVRTESFSDQEATGREGEGKSFSEIIFDQLSVSEDGTAASNFNLQSSTDAESVFGGDVDEGLTKAVNVIAGETVGNRAADIAGSFFGDSATRSAFKQDAVGISDVMSNQNIETAGKFAVVGPGTTIADISSVSRSVSASGTTPEPYGNTYTIGEVETLGALIGKYNNLELTAAGGSAGNAYAVGNGGAASTAGGIGVSQLSQAAGENNVGAFVTIQPNFGQDMMVGATSTPAFSVGKILNLAAVGGTAVGDMSRTETEGGFDTFTQTLAGGFTDNPMGVMGEDGVQVGQSVTQSRIMGEIFAGNAEDEDIETTSDFFLETEQLSESAFSGEPNTNLDSFSVAKVNEFIAATGPGESAVQGGVDIETTAAGFAADSERKIEGETGALASNLRETESRGFASIGGEGMGCVGAGCPGTGESALINIAGQTESIADLTAGAEIAQSLTDGVLALAGGEGIDGEVELASSFASKGFSGDLFESVNMDDPLAFIGVATTAGEGRSNVLGFLSDGSNAELVGKTNVKGEGAAATGVGAIDSNYVTEADAFIEGVQFNAANPALFENFADAAVRGRVDGGWGLMTKDGATIAGYLREGEASMDGFAVGTGNTVVDAVVTATGAGQAALVGDTPEASVTGGQTGSGMFVGNIAGGFVPSEAEARDVFISKDKDGSVPYVDIYGGGKYIYGGFEEAGALDYGFTQGLGGAFNDPRDGSLDVTLKSVGVGIATGLATAGEVNGFNVNGASIGGRGFGFGVGDARIEVEPALGLDDEVDVVVNSGQSVKGLTLGPKASTFGVVLGDADGKANTGTFGGGKGIKAETFGEGFGLVDLEAQAGLFRDGVFGRGAGYNRGSGYASPAGSFSEFDGDQDALTSSTP